MNSFICTQFVLPVQGTSCRYVALSRLGSWLDSEISGLEGLFGVCGCKYATEDINKLYLLHLDTAPEDREVQGLLQSALASLERLLSCVQTITSEAQFGEQVPSDFDAWLNWSGARLQDIIAALRPVLAI